MAANPPIVEKSIPKEQNFTPAPQEKLYSEEKPWLINKYGYTSANVSTGPKPEEAATGGKKVPDWGPSPTPTTPTTFKLPSASPSLSPSTQTTIAPKDFGTKSSPLVPTGQYTTQAPPPEIKQEKFDINAIYAKEIAERGYSPTLVSKGYVPEYDEKQPLPEEGGFKAPYVKVTEKPQENIPATYVGPEKALYVPKGTGLEGTPAKISVPTYANVPYIFNVPEKTVFFPSEYMGKVTMENLPPEMRETWKISFKPFAPGEGGTQTFQLPTGTETKEVTIKEGQNYFAGMPTTLSYTPSTTERITINVPQKMIDVEKYKQVYSSSSPIEQLTMLGSKFLFTGELSTKEQPSIQYAEWRATLPSAPSVTQLGSAAINAPPIQFTATTILLGGVGGIALGGLSKAAPQLTKYGTLVLGAGYGAYAGADVLGKATSGDIGKATGSAALYTAGIPLFMTGMAITKPISTKFAGFVETKVGNIETIGWKVVEPTKMVEGIQYFKETVTATALGYKQITQTQGMIISPQKFAQLTGSDLSNMRTWHPEAFEKIKSLSTGTEDVLVKKGTIETTEGFFRPKTTTQPYVWVGVAKEIGTPETIQAKGWGYVGAGTQPFESIGTEYLAPTRAFKISEAIEAPVRIFQLEVEMVQKITGVPEKISFTYNPPRMGQKSIVIGGGFEDIVPVRHKITGEVIPQEKLGHEVKHVQHPSWVWKGGEWVRAYTEEDIISLARGFSYKQIGELQPKGIGMTEYIAPEGIKHVIIGEEFELPGLKSTIGFKTFDVTPTTGWGISKTIGQESYSLGRNIGIIKTPTVIEIPTGPEFLGGGGKVEIISKPLPTAGMKPISGPSAPLLEITERPNVYLGGIGGEGSRFKPTVKPEIGRGITPSISLSQVSAPGQMKGLISFPITGASPFTTNVPTLGSLESTLSTQTTAVEQVQTQIQLPRFQISELTTGLGGGFSRAPRVFTGGGGGPFLPRLGGPGEGGPTGGLRMPTIGSISPGRKRRKGLLADLLSVAQSQLFFGKATHPKATTKEFRMAEESFYLRVPTLEMRGRGKKGLMSSFKLPKMKI